MTLEQIIVFKNIGIVLVALVGIAVFMYLWECFVDLCLQLAGRLLRWLHSMRG